MLIRHINVAGAVHGQPSGKIEPRVSSPSIGASPSGAGQRRHHSRRSYFANPVVDRITHIDKTAALNSDALRIAKPRRAPNAIRVATHTSQTGEGCDLTCGGDPSNRMVR